MDDSALAVALASRDPQGLDGVYRRYADRLHAYARTIVGDREVAADVVHDTFLLASQHAGRLRDPARLRPWLYAIARNEGLRQIKQRARIAPLEWAGDVPADLVDPAVGLQRSEVADLVRAAAAALSDTDREAVELGIRHGFEAADIADALGVSVSHAHARLSRARAQLAVALGVLLVARANTDCDELAELLRGWDGTLTPLLRKRLHRHIESCETCSGVRRERLAPAALLTSYGAIPFVPFLEPLLESTSLAELMSGRTPVEPRWDTATGFPKPAAAGAVSKTVLAAGAAAVALLLCGGAILLAPNLQSQPTPPLAAQSPLPSPVPAGTGATEPGLVPPGSSPTTSPSTSPSASSSPAPSPSKAPPSNRPSPSPSPSPALPPLSVEISASTKCTAAYTYTLSIKVSASAALQSATFHWRTSVKRQRAMTVNGNQATYTRAGFTAAKITWWVTLVAADGRTYRSEDRVVYNIICTPPG